MVKLINITGKAISGEWGTDCDSQDGIPVLRTTNFTNEGIINYNNIVLRNVKKNIKDKLLCYGDIIIEKSGGSDKQPVGRVVYFDGEENRYLFNNFTGVLRVKNRDVWNPKYVFYALFAAYKRGETRRFENRTTGLHNLQIDGYLKNFDIKEISIAQQDKICNILDNIRHQIILREKGLTYLDDLMKARFVEMFGDPIKNDKGWKTKCITDICSTIKGGGTPSKNNPLYFQGDIPWISPKDMKSELIYDSQDHITKEAIENSTTSIIPANSVLMVIRSGILKHDLPVAINKVPLTINQDIKAFILGKEIISIFLLYYFKTIKSEILSGVRAVTADNIDFKDFQKRMVILPSLSLQKQFADFADQAEKSKSVIQKSLDETQILFQSLMQKYFG